MATARILRVFTDAQSNFGDKASIVIDEGRHISDKKRQAIARELNTGETIFINNIEKADISVMHPQGEISFAGVGVLGAAWFLTKLRSKPADKLVGRNGDIATWQKGDLTWVKTNRDTLPQWNIKYLETITDVERITLEETLAMKHTIVWSWIDEKKGLIRARTFASDWDIPEAEGNGSGAMLLATILKRSIEVMHGRGSIIFARPAPDSSAEIGGRIVEESAITF